MGQHPVYRRILLKLSGEALMGDQKFGIAPDVVARLAARRLVERRQGKRDRRLKHVLPTAACGRLLARMEDPARRAHERTINPLGRRDRALFMKALAQLVTAGNDHGRAPLRIR